jgi:hypothetical protein
MVKEFNAPHLAKVEKQMEKALFTTFRPKNAIADNSSSDLVRERRAHAWIGCSVSTAAKVWYLILPLLHGPEATMARLCWALYLLKNYPEEVVGAAKVGTNEKTFSHWVWIMIEQMSYLVHDVVNCLYSVFSIVIDTI